MSELTYRFAHRKGPKTLYEEIGHPERLGTSNGGFCFVVGGNFHTLERTSMTGSVLSLQEASETLKCRK